MTFVYFAGNTADWASLLLCAGLGFIVCRRAGLFNLGLEGQIYAGGFCASAVMLALYTALPAPVVLLAGLCAAAAAGALMGALCGLLKKWFGADELITTFLVQAAVIPVIDYFIAGPLRGTEGSILAMQKLPAALVLARILPPSNLNVSVFACLALAALCLFFLYGTAEGYRLRIAGAAPAFARYGCIEPEQFWLGSLTFSGACAGLAGFFAVAGTDGICHLGFPAGLGWAAIAAGLIARSEPLFLIAAALFYAILKFSTGAALLSTGASGYLFTAITACMLFISTIPRFPRRRP